MHKFNSQGTSKGLVRCNMQSTAVEDKNLHRRSQSRGLFSTMETEDPTAASIELNGSVYHRLCNVGWPCTNQPFEGIKLELHALADFHPIGSLLHLQLHCCLSLEVHSLRTLQMSLGIHNAVFELLTIIWSTCSSNRSRHIATQ
eukprot:5189927-Amphidinium_carterae.1